MMLRIYMGEADRWHRSPLYQALAVEARKLELAGASVFRGIVGYGSKRVLHTQNLLDLSTDLPIVFELVDTEENLERFLIHIKPMLGPHSLVTLTETALLRPAPSEDQA